MRVGNLLKFDHRIDHRTHSSFIQRVAKSLEKEKSRRYASAAELASDIRHYLSDEPIVARPASTIYQLKKFAKRNKAFLITNNIAQDSLRRVGWSSQQIGQSAVLNPPEEGLSADLTKTRNTYNNYVRYAGWDDSTVAGKRMLELSASLAAGPAVDSEGSDGVWVAESAG